MNEFIATALEKEKDNVQQNCGEESKVEDENPTQPTLRDEFMRLKQKTKYSETVLAP